MKAARRYLTQEELKRVLTYDPTDGLFRYTFGRGTRKAGCVAGHLNGKGKVVIKIYDVRYMAGRLAFLYMTGRWPVHEAFHINHIGSDNRWSNLLDLNKKEISERKLPYLSNKSGFTGVFKHKWSGKWNARLVRGDVCTDLGYFTTKIAAAYARHQAVMDYNETKLGEQPCLKN